MGCETNCLNEHRLQSVEKELSELRNRNSQEHKGFYDRIEGLEKENAVLKKDIEYIKETIDEMNGNLKILIETPAKRYETIIACVITTVVGALIGFLLSGVLPM